MKKYIKYIGLVLVGMVVFSCNKDSFNYKPGYVGISKITHYPDFTIKGNADTSLVVGSSYTDPGATAVQGTTTLKVTSAGTVNTSVVGLYSITYSAINSDGFPGSTTRYIAVLPSAEHAGIDISGNYNYAAGGTTVTMSKLASGFYYVTGVYSASTVIPAYLICVDGTNIIVPSQATAYGNMNGTAVLSGITSGSTLNYNLNLPDQGIANSVRKWIKK